MTEQDKKIQDLKAENAKLKEQLKEQSKPTEPTDMDKITTEMMEHICDNLCMHPIRVGQTQDELDDICAECKMGKFVCDILNTYNRLNDFDKTQSYDLLKKLSEYRNLEEQGLLLKLLCKVGDTVYSITRDFISEYIVESIRIYEHSIQFYWKCTKGIYHNVVGFADFEIGKTVFLTEQEAQAALEKMKHETLL